MNKYEGLKQEILENDLILIDTCSVMNTKALEEFVDNLEMFLMENRKKIIVPDAVWGELLKHIDTSCAEKQEKALQATTIISLHRHIFQVDIMKGHTGQNKYCFADKELLLSIIKNKNRFRQLLISSDKDLIDDTLKINDQKSYLGKTISTYYFDQFGNSVFRKPENSCFGAGVKKVTAVFNKSISETGMDSPDTSKTKITRIITKIAECAGLFSAGTAVGYSLTKLLDKS